MEKTMTATTARATAAREYTFNWEGTDRRGSRVRGESVGVSDVFVKTQLRKQGINPTRVRRKARGLGGGRRIKGADISIFSRQLATMMAAGVPLVQSLEIMGRGHAHPGMGRLILALKSDVESGRSLTEAMARHPRQFDDLYVNLVDAGERSGTLELLLDKIATYKEKTETLKRKVRKALTYPTAVLVVAVIVTGILLYFVVPEFSALFTGFGADLPAFTKMVIGLSNFVRTNGLMIIGAIIAAAVAFRESYVRSPRLRRTVDRVLLKVPAVGTIVYKSAVARFTRTLSTMFAAGVPLVEAMTPVARATGNIIFQEATLKIRDEVATGTRLQTAMQQTGLFPAMATQMIGIGEESGALDTMSAKVAEFYEAEVDTAVDNLSTLLEPMIMVILGVLVGSLVIAMYLPIFKLGEAI
jgi:Type II secretory pathway, component PulF